MVTLGRLSEVNLTSLIQTNCLELRTVRITVQSAWQVGDIYIADGNALHAVVGDIQGEAAIDKMLAWRTGTFRVEEGRAAPRVSITTPWGRLLSNRFPQNEAVDPPSRNCAPAGEGLRAVSPEIQAQDEFLGTNLSLVLRDLEQNLTNIFKSARPKQPLRTVILMANAINRMLDLMVTHPDGATMSPRLIKNLVNGAAPGTETGQLIGIHHHQIHVRALRQTYQHEVGKLPGGATAFADIADQLSWMLCAVSTATVDLIQTPALHQEGQKICDAFLLKVNTHLEGMQVQLEGK